ncbi:MAG: VCBS repeat-containing protein, partial [Pseudomonadota bacterium]
GFGNNTQRRMLAQVSGSQEPDIVVFGADGVYIAQNDGNGQFTVLCNGDPCVEDYSPAQGYTDFGNNPRYLSDMTGDGLADIVAFSDDGVIIAVSAQVSFIDPSPGEFAIRRFGPNSGGWTTEAPRIILDVNGDGFDDIVGFGFSQTAYARARPDRDPTLYSNTETYDGLFTQNGGWDTANNIRTSADINGDGLEDVVAYADDSVLVSYARDIDIVPNGALTGPANLQTLSDEFGLNDGWQLPDDQRYLADVNGDGFLDLVGFGPSLESAMGGVSYALNLGDGGDFGVTREWLPEFSFARGYTFRDNPRFMGDVNGDGRSDIIVFDDNTVEVVFALSASE